MKDIVYFLKQIHSYAGGILYVNMLAMTFIGLLESAGILLLIPMISISGIVHMDVMIPKSLNVFGFLETIPDFIVLPMILGIYMAIVLADNLLERQILIQNAKIQNGFLRKVRIDTYNTLLHSNWAFFIKNRKSDLINILLTEVSRTSGGTNAFLQFLASLIFTFIQIGLAFILSPHITFFVLISGVFLVVLNRRFLKKSWASGNRNYELGKSFLAGVTDQISGIKDIKSNSLEESRIEWFRSLTKQMETEQVEYTKLKMTSQFYYKFSSTLLIAIFIFISVRMFHAQAGQLMLIIIIFGRLWPRVAGIQSSMEQIATTFPSFKAVKAFQMECEEAKEFQKRNHSQILELKEGMECRNVQFRYDKNDSNYTLQDINLFIPANQTTAFVGRSGAGKSTLIDLLMGLNQPETGQILVDGRALTEDYMLSLRSTLSYVPQDPFLFNGSIRENLMLVKPNATEEDMWEALTFASASTFVSKLKHGLDSLIGDRGIKLSGGERQRLVLARAILRKPSILVLDEATSALDTESESNIQVALEHLKGKMTIIVIAHRLSTIRNADQVIVLDEGKIIQRGGFNQLSQEKNKVFSMLLKKQMEIVQ